jgi:hypothetical protein
MLTNMRVRALHLAFLPLLCPALLWLSALNVTAQSEGPEVTDCFPKTGSINSVLALQGYRLSPSESGKTKAYFLQNGNKYPASTGGGSSTTNDERNGPQSLEVIVPEGVVPGPCQIVVEANGLRSAPVTVSIIEWTLPRVTRVAPASGSPGTFVDILCTGFHIYDEIEITDALGKVTTFESGGSTHGTGFTVPKDAPEGVMTIRIGNRKYGNDKYTEPFNFLVTSDPLPLELWAGFMTPVAPGQWIDLQASSLEPLKHSERTELAFKQGGRSIIVAAPKPQRPHVGVPSALSPGDLQLQVRTWRGGHASAWSEPVQFRLTERPVPPSVGALRLEKGNWVQLWPGPDRTESFSATAGDLIIINGTFPVADASRLKVALIGPEGSIALIPYELDERADWFGTLCVKLPEALHKGDWRMTVSSSDDGTQVELPIIIHID